MGDLSENFSRHEFTCKCGCGYDAVHPLLIQTLQHMRNRAGVPITITSGCRCHAHNARVGGAKASRHMSGVAADFVIQGWDADRTMALIHQLVVNDEAYVGYAYKVPRTRQEVVHLDVRIPESMTVRRWKNDREA